jgi:hypothetical protein
MGHVLLGVEDPAEHHAAGAGRGGWLGGWVAGWLGGWVAGWLGGWVAGWLGGWVAGWLGGWVAGGRCEAAGYHLREVQLSSEAKLLPLGCAVACCLVLLQSCGCIWVHVRIPIK